MEKALGRIHSIKRRLWNQAGAKAAVDKCRGFAPQGDKTVTVVTGGVH
jgi:hypothetical protein